MFVFAWNTKLSDVKFCNYFLKFSHQYLADSKCAGPGLGAIRLEVGVILVGRDAAISHN